MHFCKHFGVKTIGDFFQKHDVFLNGRKAQKEHWNQLRQNIFRKNPELTRL